MASEINLLPPESWVDRRNKWLSCNIPEDQTELLMSLSVAKYVWHWQTRLSPTWNNITCITSVLMAALNEVMWFFFFFPHLHPAPRLYFFIKAEAIVKLKSITFKLNLNITASIYCTSLIFNCGQYISIFYSLSIRFDAWPEEFVTFFILKAAISFASQQKLHE